MRHSMGMGSGAVCGVDGICEDVGCDSSRMARRPSPEATFWYEWASSQKGQ